MTKPPRPNLSSLLAGLVLVLTSAYLIIVLYKPQLGPLDDHILLSTVYAGKWLPFFVSPQNGRFYPLDAQELNIVALISTAPFAFYLVNAAQLILIVWVFFDLNRRLSGKTQGLVAATALLITPGFALAWTRLQIPERDSLFFFTIFLWCYIRAGRENIWTVIGCLLSANLALYYKEPGFLALGTFAVVRLLLADKYRDRRLRVLDWLLLASAAGFALAYYLVVYRHHPSGATTYGQTQFNWLLVLLRNLATYLLSDPLIMAGVPAAAAWRLYRTISGRDQFEPLADGLLAAALAYIPVFFVMGLYATPYYLLPAYAFALPAILVYWGGRSAANRIFWNVWLVLVLFLTVTSAVPLTLYSLSFNKYVAQNHSGAVSFLARDMLAHPDRQSDIYLDGADPQKSMEIYISLKSFLSAAGVPDASIQIRYLKDWRAAGPRPGDYLVITPFDEDNADDEDLAAAARSWHLVWASSSPLAIPNVSLKVAMKFAAMHFLMPGKAHAIGASERYSYPVDYKILVKR